MPRTKKPSHPSGPPGFGTLVAHFLLIAVGLGLITCAVANLLPASRARLILHHDPEYGVTGSLSYMFARVPVFWRSLNGLDHLEDQSYSRNTFGSKTGRFQAAQTVSRFGFVDAKGRTLAWTERGPLHNQRSRITDFLKSDEPTFEYEDETSPKASMSSIAFATTVLGAVALSSFGMLIILFNLRGAWRVVPSLRSPSS